MFGSHCKNIFYRKREIFSLFRIRKIAEVLILPSFMTYVRYSIMSAIKICTQLKPKHLRTLFFFDEWWYFVVCIIIDLGVACGHTIFFFRCHFVSIYVHVLWINQKLCSWTNCGHINYCLCHFVSLYVHLQWQVYLLQFLWALNLGV